MSETWNDGTSLYHYGILGQKWGQRRWQNEDGSFNYEGKVRYGRIGNRRASNINDSKNQADKEAISKVIRIGMSAALIGVGLYAGYKISTNSEYTVNLNPNSSDTTFIKTNQNRLDNKITKVIEEKTNQDNTVRYGPLMYPVDEPLKDTIETNYSDNPITLEKGTKIQRVSRYDFEDMTKRGQTYVSYLLKDNEIYRTRFTHENLFDFGEADAYVHELRAKETIKAPSSKELAKMYLEISPNTSDMVYRHVLTQGLINGYDKKASKSDADPITKIFYEEAQKLRAEVLKRGYNAIIDPVDSEKYASAPLIILNPSENLLSESVRKLSDADRKRR